MSDYSQTAHDLELRYRDTFVRYRASEEQPWSVCLVQEIATQSNDWPFITLRSASGTQKVKYGGAGEFLFGFPEIGNFNYDNIGYTYRRVPVRQNKRALCNATSKRGNFYTEMKWCTLPGLGIHMADAIFNPHFPDFTEARKMLADKVTYCVALDSEYSIGLSPIQRNQLLLFRGTTPLGTSGSSFIYFNPFFPEFKEFVNEFAERFV